eukprot:m.38604 g.38604  ORF g.38604 m.38604 type:complete len:630 (+) comp10007_c0_seq1:53-1942(+)
MNTLRGENNPPYIRSAPAAAGAGGAIATTMCGEGARRRQPLRAVNSALNITKAPTSTVAGCQVLAREGAENVQPGGVVTRAMKRTKSTEGPASKRSLFTEDLSVIPLLAAAAPPRLAHPHVVPSVATMTAVPTLVPAAPMVVTAQTVSVSGFVAPHPATHAHTSIHGHAQAQVQANAVTLIQHPLVAPAHVLLAASHAHVQAHPGPATFAVPVVLQHAVPANHTIVPARTAHVTVTQPVAPHRPLFDTACGLSLLSAAARIADQSQNQAVSTMHMVNAAATHASTMACHPAETVPAPGPASKAVASLVSNPAQTTSVPASSSSSNPALSAFSITSSTAAPADTQRPASAVMSPARQAVPPGIDDIDDDPLPLLASEYAPDIYSYLASAERRSHPHPYMHTQQEITPAMRVILVDWLVEVHNRFSLLPETLYLAVHLLDAFMSLKPVLKRNLQLTGVTAMFLACKYEEICPPEIEDFVQISDRVFSSEDIRVLERAMLAALHFDLSHPPCIHFLRRFSRAGQAGPMLHCLSKYLMELSLVSYEMLSFLPSQVAAAALLLARTIMHYTEPWDATLTYYSGYTAADIAPAVALLAALLAAVRDGKNKAVFQKYSTSRFSRVSIIPSVFNFSL